MSQETILSNYKGKYQDKYLASTEFGKEASGTIGDYLTGTITLVFGIFFLFLLLSLLTIILTTYARYKARSENPSSFANPPPRAYRPQLQVTRPFAENKSLSTTIKHQTSKRSDNESFQLY